MTDWATSFAEVVFVAASACFIGGSFALGVTLVCRALKWAPVNVSITVNANHLDQTQEP